ncbi:MAG: glycoside hydrolase family 3 C-terminal domain-containing protein [Corallococcus sp.]|nr:glycoside hydrolase family 3 C-terminal domain-containing protein [Corallococcus sp.]MCM1360147.1 glycoside hydrolase family 3 C-terminal domain-containing protein [Corallococcus sp.]MCM1395464.1 glycoside hydrolase family 3 C-terminal domain-containing protein [Corallococcus sp.]
MKNSTNQDILQQLTTDEKVQLTTGYGAWNTASVSGLDLFSANVSDGPVGLRHYCDGQVVPAVAFPSVSKLACSFDPSVLREAGAAIGEQARKENVNVILAPGLNIKRDPRCGRNFEYYSEDPFLTAELANAYVKGVNSQEVGVCIKHFAANNQEYGRRVSDSVVDMRALREIYLSAFERVVKQSKPCAVMCAYNKLNGEYCCQNKWLLTDVLRKEWGYDGLAMSDWGATDDRAKGIAAGLDLEMPQGDTEPVTKAIADGTLKVEQLDVAAGRVIAFASQFKDNSPRNADYDYQHNLVRKISADTTVLAKNNCKLLPFKKDDEIAVIGALAETPYFQGGGSSQVLPYKKDNLLEALDAFGAKYRYAKGYDLNNAENEQLLREAAQLAAESAKVLLLVGPYGTEFEWQDRATWQLPKAQLDVIDAVTSANSNVAIVVQSGSPVDVSWHHGAKALVFDYLGGEQSGGALCDVVFGVTCPTGRLAETWPLSLPKFTEDFGKDFKRTLYKESIYVGYRYYVTAGVPVAFPFGHGLNYADIAWSNAKSDVTSVDPDGKVKLSLELHNASDFADADTVQAYVTNLDGRGFYAKRNLVAFKKVRLKPSEKKTVTLEVNVSDFASYDVDAGKFVVNGGKYLLTLARNANDAGYAFTVEVKGDNNTADVSREFACYYEVDENFCPTDKQFEKLYGTFPEEQTTPFTFNSPLAETQSTKLGKRLVRSFTKGLSEEDKRSNLAAPLIDFTWRPYITREIIYLLVDILNGGKGRFKVWKLYRANKKSDKKRKK